MGDVENLGVASFIYFFSSSMISIFLPVYYITLGLSISQIAVLLFATFMIMGLLPITLLSFIRDFERMVCFGVFFTMIFYVLLIYVKDPVVLGITCGLSIATFWPSFNLLQFRLSKSKIRARFVSLFSMIIPSIASIVGPAVGGLIVENFGFPILLGSCATLYFTALIFFAQVKFRREIHGLLIPTGPKIYIFFVTFIILGMAEAYWLAYPLFVSRISGTISRMGLVIALTSLIVSAISFLVNWLSDIKMRRVEFSVIGVLLNALWFFLIGYATTPQQIVLLSTLSGLAGAFTISWLAYYGDQFSPKQYASILVLREMGLMLGRILNLIPTVLLITKQDYSRYFMLLGIFTLLNIPLLVYSKHVKSK